MSTHDPFPAPPGGPTADIGIQDLRLALAGHAAAQRPAPDPQRLRAGLRRADQVRTLRRAVAVGALGLVAAIGLTAVGGDDTAIPVDVAGRTGLPAAAPTTALPEVLDPVVDRAIDGAAPDPVGEAPATGDAPVAGGDAAGPAHLTPGGEPAILPVAEATTTTTVPPTVPPTTTAPPTTVPTTTVPPTPTTTAAPPPTVAPTTTAPPAVALTAAARYGSCGEDPPYDEYDGTTTPGGTVTITSPHSAPVQITADGSGHWAGRVDFPSAPVGTPFDVTVSDGAATVVLSFVRTA